jgi:hypothetical protein
MLRVSKATLMGWVTVLSSSFIFIFIDVRFVSRRTIPSPAIVCNLRILCHVVNLFLGFRLGLGLDQGIGLGLGLGLCVEMDL